MINFILLIFAAKIGQPPSCIMFSSNNKNSSNLYKPFTDIVIGISDGLIIPFAIITGLSVIAADKLIIVQGGLAAIVVGAFVLALGGYFAAKSRQESFAQQTAEEEAAAKKDELDKTIHLFKQLDLDQDMQDQAAEVIENDSNEWKAYLKKHQVDLEINDTSKLPKTALIIGLSYAIGGMIPLLSYLYFTNTAEAFVWSCSITLLALVIVGFIKSKVNKEPLLWGTFRLMLLGGVAAAVAYAVASIFTT